MSYPSLEQNGVKRKRKFIITMPACASESYPTGERFRSSSPPNSRSNSASPPLTWPSAGAMPSGSPGQISPIGTLFKRSVSNLSNSSLFHANSSFSEQSSSTGFSSMDSSNVISSPSSPDHHPHCQHSRDRDPDERNVNTSHLTNASITKRIFRKCQDGDGRNSASSSDSGVAGSGGATQRGSSRSGLYLPARLLAWYLNLVFSAVRRIQETLSYIIWAPIIWISAWICVFWVLIQLPLNILKWLLLALYTPADERARSKRCVLISGGSTLQALHLARNFYKAGARVVVCEVDGLFGLARFSTACARFYSVPRPGPGTAAEYVNALKKIAQSENAVYYVPVSSTVDAYYDALAKPHLEILGCECFVPGAAEVTTLEDPMRMIQRCISLGLNTPVHFVLNSPDDLVRLYEDGQFAGNERHVMLSAGPAGMRERTKFLLPSSPVDGPPRNLRQKLEQYEISERRPWLVIREPAGTHQLVTCTTVKDSRVVANVTCRLDEARGLIPEDRSDIDQWLEAFFSRPFATRINGHLSFKLAFSAEDGLGLLALGCRVGVPLPYLCLTSVHPRLVWRPCRHFSRQNSANLLVNDRYKQSAANVSSKNSSGLQTRIRSPGSATTVFERRANSLIVSRTTVLDKRDALFVYWDPLPYCAYYHLQLPFRRLAGAIRERPAQHKPPLAVVQ